jgi:2-polyprenyl-3-methyl-5-hydroxy-6-metoxy-1,4-benzoquinol methylase
MSGDANQCWVCQSRAVDKVRDANYLHELSSSDFAITDAAYGTTHDIYRCNSCGFLFCPDTPPVLPYYERLVDEDYEESRAPRLLQAGKLLAGMKVYLAAGQGRRLLDVGAGSGILLERAEQMGWQARGVEPSQWLASQALSRKLDVVVGVLPHAELAGAVFDVVTLIDVIEHVSDPGQLLVDLRPYLHENGVLYVVTPDVSALVARLLGRKWWHFRLAHIGYFSPANLRELAENCGYSVVAMTRPSWYFSLDYVVERVNAYLPGWLQLPIFSWMKRLNFPLNFFDSMQLILRRTNESPASPPVR